MRNCNIDGCCGIGDEILTPPPWGLALTPPDRSGDADAASSTPYFERDGNRIVPTEMARGGWGPSVSGHAVGGILGWAVERAVDDAALQPARLTVDLPRPTT